MTDTIKNEPRKNPEQTEPLERPVSSASSTASNASLPPAGAAKNEEADATLTEFDIDTETTETIDDQSKLKELPKSEDDGLSTTSSASSMSALPKAKQFNLSVLASGEISKTKSVDKKQISVPKRGKSRSKSGEMKVDKDKDKEKNQDSNKEKADKLTMEESKPTTTTSSPKDTTSKPDDKPETTPIDSNSSISPRPKSTDPSNKTTTAKVDTTDDDDDENIPEDKVENPSKKNLASQRGLKGRKTNQTEFILKKIIGFGRFFCLDSFLNVSSFPLHIKQHLD